jgi:hypothetical protein
MVCMLKGTGLGGRRISYLTYRKVPEMWENETVVLVVSLKKRIMGGAEKVRFGRISADNAIPPFIKILFKNRVEEYLIQESPLTFRSTPHFDIKPEDVEGLKTQILDVFREAAFFKQDEVEELLREALVMRLDYLVKPVSTMNRLLFEKKTEILIADLEKTVNPFTKVLPYAEQLIKESRRLGYTEIEKDEYRKLAGDVVKKMAGVEPLKLVLHDFSVLTDFLSETKGEEIARVEGGVIREFLEDRLLTPFRRALEVEMKLGKEDFDAADLEMTLKRYIELRLAFDQAEVPLTQDKKKKEETVAQTEGIVSDLKEVRAEAESKQTIDESWDLDSVLGEETPLLETESAKEEPAVEEKPKSKKPMRIIRRDQKEEEETLLESEPLESLEAELVPEKKSPFGKLGGFRELIDEKTEKVFVKKLFNGDGDAYSKLLQKLDEAESWRVAKILIDNELFKRDVDPFSREAIKLVDLIYSRYYPEEGVGGKR